MEVSPFPETHYCTSGRVNMHIGVRNEWCITRVYNYKAYCRLLERKKYWMGNDSAYNARDEEWHPNEETTHLLYYFMLMIIISHTVAGQPCSQVM